MLQGLIVKLLNRMTFYFIKVFGPIFSGVILTFLYLGTLYLIYWGGDHYRPEWCIVGAIINILVFSMVIGYLSGGNDGI